jgi:TonB family protein
MTRMLRIRCVVVAAALVGALWAQNNGPATPNSGASEPPSQSKQPDAPASPQPPTNPEQPVASHASAASVPALPDSTVLEVVKRVKATYPVEAEKEKLQGEVVLKIVVSETGDVESTEVVSGHPVLANAAISAVKKWKFQPFIRDGKPRKVSTKLPFDFAFSDKVMVDDTSTATNENRDKNSALTGVSNPAKRIRVSSGVTQGLLLRRVDPVYPDDARRARIQGTVILGAIIGRDGAIKDLHVVSGDPLLSRPALDAVQLWRYRPYLLMGDPVEVETTIEVHFTLRAY